MTSSLFTIHARRPVVDDKFFPTVPGSNFTCVWLVKSGP